MKKIAKRAHIESTAQTMNIIAADLESKGKDVIKLHTGAPSTGAPKAALDYFNKIDHKKIMGYSSALGIQPLRERIAQHYYETYGLKIDTNRIIATVGASGALMLALLSWFDAGDKIALPLPAYGAYTNTMKLMGLEIVDIPTFLENRLLPTVDDLKKAYKKDKFKGILFASPGNPSGSVLQEEEIKELLGFCKKNNIRVIFDEIYHGLVYGDNKKTPCALSFDGDIVVINSFSKYYSMPGWRVGWMVVPDNLIDSIGAIMRNILICPPTPSQWVAMKSMDCTDELNKHIVRYRKNRDLLIEGLPHAKFDKIAPPDGAFYIYAHIQHSHEDSTKFCFDLLNKSYITSQPGTDFDHIHGRKYIRLSYAGKTEDIEKVIDRLIKARKNI